MTPAGNRAENVLGQHAATSEDNNIAPPDKGSRQPDTAPRLSARHSFLATGHAADAVQFLIEQGFRQKFMSVVMNVLKESVV